MVQGRNRGRALDLGDYFPLQQLRSIDKEKVALLCNRGVDHVRVVGLFLYGAFYVVCFYDTFDRF